MSASVPSRHRPTAVAASRAVAGLACLLAVALPGLLTAQSLPELRVGQVVTGTLGPSDPVMLSGMGPFRAYRLEAAKGDRLIFTLRSGAFDAYLTVMRPVGGVHETLAGDDDGGGGSDARLRWTAPATGTYVVLAQAYGSDASGGFTLSAERAPPTRPVVALPVAVGETRSGTLTEESPLVETEEDEVFHDLYAFDGRAGQEVLITLDAEDFDALLVVGHLSGNAIEEIASDDDGGGGTNSRLRVTLPADGRYGIQARALGSGGTGRYTLTLREAPPVVARPLTPGREVTEDLGDEGFAEWTLQGRAGERYVLTVSSGNFDTVLTFGRRAEGRFESLEENDDAEAGTTNSRLEVTLPADGTYVIRVAGFGGAASGNYTLRAEVVR